MTNPEWLALGCLALLVGKHLVVDFFLQTTYLLRTKGIYGHPGGLAHAGMHALASFPALFVFFPPAWVFLALPAAEFVIHYHLDWAKQQIRHARGLGPADAAYWWLFGTDQAHHHATYLGMVAVLLLV